MKKKSGKFPMVTERPKRVRQTNKKAKRSCGCGRRKSPSNS